ncbi:TPA: phage antirepressor KilAC domain-containing protein [Staphylococcus aureus]|uniref:phage antirepressor KilAC domain-containing protein n=2 Tax=Staphylococcus aureus TaxID=1280 RepID=UPI000A67233F|nr:phage antirepressor KilAC domain-containing protein [Staphylococcus aureus]EGQ1487934.1 phage antirepressor Ant [Staphylococcus aureus]MBN5671322.1 phage antirepressor KilAC domain-containing protein [Staphylococcus aureus]MDD9394530.1 phage antirepressor KilAC domain-containing protein [Staphylococcus aureus]MDT3782989.1 phage antirepressor KilAC domain-containing protein [Staphylococcus aureus]MDT3817304.1 phage antirepressor KilAC domain-containing protein [Staphylococcus aureus]
MNEIKAFSNDMFSILIKQNNENNLFDLETVAKSLGITQFKNGKEYVKWERVNKYLSKYLSPQVGNFSQPLGKGDFIPEAMVYKLAFKAGNSTAEKFQDWLAMEVLPAIRKHGIYATDNVIEQTLKDPDYIITVLTEYKKEKEQNLLLQQEIGELKPKADYVDEILKSTGTLATTQIAADYGISAQKLNKLLHEARLQRKVNKQWVLYSEHMGKSYTDSDTITIVRSDGREDTVLQTRWTQKGRLKIHEIMTEFGYEANLGGA